MKKALIISYSPLHRDPRILRQIKALKEDYRIYTIGDTPVPDRNITHYSNSSTGKKNRKFCHILARKIIKLFKLIHNFYRFKSTLTEFKLNFSYIFSQNIETPDVIIANDWDGLYLASEIKARKRTEIKIYFDAHEYAPRQHDESFKWRLFEQPLIIAALKKCKKDISLMSTVCEGIAVKYEMFFNFPNNFIRIITNAPEYQPDLRPNNIQDNKIRLIHHGFAVKVRRLELMIKMMKYLDPDKYELSFMLVHNNQKYYNYLIKRAQKHRNIRFIDPVVFSEIPETINAYDIGLSLILPENFNHQHCLPNKFFEFIQARLAVAIGPSVEMVKIIDRYNIGVYSKYFSSKSLAASIRQITPNTLMKYKLNADICAKELNADKNLKKIKDIIFELAGD